MVTDPELAAVGLTEQQARDAGLDVATVSHGISASVGGILHAATVAVVGKVPIDTLWHAVPAFPTVSELWLRLLEADRGL